MTARCSACHVVVSQVITDAESPAPSRRSPRAPARSRRSTARASGLPAQVHLQPVAGLPVRQSIEGLGDHDGRHRPGRDGGTALLRVGGEVGEVAVFEHDLGTVSQGTVDRALPEPVTEDLPRILEPLLDLCGPECHGQILADQAGNREPFRAVTLTASWQEIRFTTRLQRLSREITRRSRVVGIFLEDLVAIRLSVRSSPESPTSGPSLSLPLGGVMAALDRSRDTAKSQLEITNRAHRGSRPDSHYVAGISLHRQYDLDNIAFLPTS